MTTRHVANYEEAKQPGDYWKDGDYVFLRCPFCEHIYDVTKWLVTLDPLTLEPSVRDLNPQRACHFFIRQGQVINC